MKITYNWLKDFVEIKISPEALADKLTMAGLEVTSLEKRDGDFVFEIEITSNRPDWLSVIGIAREIAAITAKKLKIVTSHAPQVTRKGVRRAACDAQSLSIKIEDKKDCPLYTAKIIKGVKVSPSPDWLKKRLELIGCRSINNIVDITNYILFTWGEPLHAFDLDKILSCVPQVTGRPLKIITRRAKNGEEIVTIDGAKRTLDESALVIASASDTGPGSPLALAGIIGGKDTEVTEETKSILLEAAVFNPILIRRARQKLGVQTDSSYRFERGIVFETAENASREAARLICEIAGGSLALAKDSGFIQTKKRRVKLSRLTVPGGLGVEIKVQEIKRILVSLGFRVKTDKNNNFSVEVPAFRQDILLEIDLVEEVARIFGYENIPQSLPALYPEVTTSLTRTLLPVLKNILVGLGINEAINYSLIDKEMLKGWEDRLSQPPEILNPLNREQEVLRPTIIPSLLKCIAHNLNQKQEQISLFEIADVFSAPGGEAPKEELALGIVLCGVKSLLLEDGCVKYKLGMLHLKGILETVFQRLGIKDYYFNTTDIPGEIVLYAAQENIGTMRIIQDNVLVNFEIKNKSVVAAELNLDKLFSHAGLKKSFAKIARYPGISRDISLVIGEGVRTEDILSAIKEKGRELLREVKVVDYYKGKQIPPGFKGMTISCLYRCDERTLTEEEILSILSLALKDSEKGLGSFKVKFDKKALSFLAQACQGDARRALNALEIGVLTTPVGKNDFINFDLQVASASIQKKPVLYDKDEDAHYDTASAFIKSMRGSDPDAALYWLAKMLYAGEDPRFIARRICILASEDVGNADPLAIVLANAALQVAEFVGMPEARIILAQAVVYVACAPKSNASYKAIQAAYEDIEKKRVQEVPDHLKDASYSGAEALGRGKGYKYAHDYQDHYVEQEYTRTKIKYYEPTDIGYEAKIKKRLQELRKPK